MEDGTEVKEPPKDLIAIRASLEKTFENYVKPFVDKDNPRIVSVGSGFGYEVGALSKLFPNMTYKGIESQDIVFGAKRLNSDIPGNIEFIAADARDPKSFGEGNWDIVLIRHPQVKGSAWKEYGTVEDWKKILQNSANAVSENGVIVITSDSEAEIEDARQMLARPGISFAPIQENLFPSDSPHHDSYIITGKKNEI